MIFTKTISRFLSVAALSLCGVVLSSGFSAAHAAQPLILFNPMNALQVGVAVNTTMAYGATPRITFTCSVHAGSLPDGLTLDPSSCAISGVPTSSGPYRFELKSCLPSQLVCQVHTYEGLIPSAPATSNDVNVSGSNLAVTGLSLSAGYNYSQINANGASGYGNTGTLALAYTSTLGSRFGGGNLQPTLGVVLTQTIGSMGSATSTSTTTGPEAYDPDCFCFRSKSSTVSNSTKVQNTTALTIQPGVMVGDRTHVYLNGGVLVTNKNGSATTGGRVGLGVCEALSKAMALCLEGNHDQIGGTSVNAVGINLKVSLNDWVSTR